MGYNTEWTGCYEIYNGKDKRAKLPKKVAKLIIGISKTRRMRRDTALLAKRLRMSKEKCERLYGFYGERYIEKNYETTLGQTNFPEIGDYNREPPNQPGLWCNFTYNQETRVIEWNGSDKTYDGQEWITYIRDLLLDAGFTLKGTMSWQGEDEDDNGDLTM